MTSIKVFRGIFYRALTSGSLFLKFRLLEMEVKRGTIEQLRAATMPI